MAGGLICLDTNILVYAVDIDAADKHGIALGIVESLTDRSCILVLQTLAEFFHVTARKNLLSVDDAEAFIASWRDAFPVAAADIDSLGSAIRIVRQRKWSFWDAMLVATARNAGCAVLISEDMHAGPIDGLEILNPFAVASRQRLADVLAK